MPSIRIQILMLWIDGTGGAIWKSVHNLHNRGLRIVSIFRRHSDGHAMGFQSVEDGGNGILYFVTQFLRSLQGRQIQWNNEKRTSHTFS